MTRTAFVTGASGFIGSHLVRALLKEDWRIRALVHRSDITESGDIQIIRGDICDSHILRRGLEGADTVFHLASALGASILKEEEFHRINAAGTEALLEISRESGAERFIHFSSAGVLGSVSGEAPAEESAPAAPINAYDRTKLAGERAAQKAAAEGRNIVIIRPGWVYGPEDKRTFKLIKAVARRRFFLISKGNALQTPVYIDDLISGTLAAAEKGKSGNIYHLAGPEALGVHEIAQTIAGITGTSIPRIRLPLPPVRLGAFMLEALFTPFGKEAPLTRGKLAFFIHPKPLSIAKASRELNYQPRITLKDGMSRAISWYRKAGWLA